MSKRLLAALALVALPATAQPPRPSADGEAGGGDGEAGDGAAGARGEALGHPPQRHHRRRARARLHGHGGQLVFETKRARPEGDGLLRRLHAVDGGAKAADRPLTFSFNGGPGSSSVWLHLGALGPRRVTMPDDGHGAARRRTGWWRTRSRCSTSRTSSSSTRSAPASAGRRRARAKRVPRPQGGHRVGRASSSGCWLTAQRALDLAHVPDRRELRHHPRRRAGRLPPGPPRHVLQRRHADLLGPQLPDRPLRRRQRPALHAVPAHLHGDRLVPRPAPGGAPDGDRRRLSTRRRSSPSATTPWRCSRATSCRPRSEHDVAAAARAAHRAAREYIEDVEPAARDPPLHKELLRDEGVHRGPARQPVRRQRPRGRRPTATSSTRATRRSRGPTRPC